MDDKRTESRLNFLANAGWAGAKVEILAADASFRSYYRVGHGERRCVLMDAPPPKEDVRPYQTAERALGHQSGLTVAGEVPRSLRGLSAYVVRDAIDGLGRLRDRHR